MGQVLSEILTFIPQGVGVLAGMAGAACAFFPIPLTLALLLGLFGGQTDLIPVIVIGAVIGFIVSKAVAPLLPKPRVELWRFYDVGDISRRVKTFETNHSL